MLPATETCDGKDNDCDGATDESLSQTCYSGSSGTQGTGLCIAGVKTCAVGRWGTCQGEVTPIAEVCDAKDNDCNGAIDDGLVKACYSGSAATLGIGTCTAGTTTCAAGKWGACQGEMPPGVEVCDDKDNDCDGFTDESLVRSCYKGGTGTQGVGPCKAGSQTCGAGKWGSCVGQVTPAAELCDNKDNDCDGSVDEALARSCYSGPSGTSGKGLCHAGVQTCSAGKWGSCAGQVVPATEVCDNNDNDCDGSVDDSLYLSCVAGAGVCTSGTRTCTAGKWGSCVSQVAPSAEICDGKDNDCDGSTDEAWGNCGTSAYTGTYQCSGSSRQRQYLKRGCTSGKCYSKTEWHNVQSCGSGSYNGCGSWSYYCSGQQRKRKRTCYSRGCSGKSCYNNAWTHAETVQTCGSGSYNSCGSWSYYCSGQQRKRKRTCYSRGCSGSSCYNNAWAHSETVQTCATGSWTDYGCSGTWRRKRTCSKSCYGSTCGTSCGGWSNVQNCGGDYCESKPSFRCCGAGGNCPSTRCNWYSAKCNKRGCSAGSCYDTYSHKKWWMSGTCGGCCALIQCPFPCSRPNSCSNLSYSGWECSADGCITFRWPKVNGVTLRSNDVADLGQNHRWCDHHGLGNWRSTTYSEDNWCATNTCVVWGNYPSCPSSLWYTEIKPWNKRLKSITCCK